MTTTTNEVNAAKKKEGEIISAIKAGKTVTTDGREFALTSHCGKERIALRVSNGGLIHACRDDIMGAAIVESGTDGEPVKISAYGSSPSALLANDAQAHIKKQSVTTNFGKQHEPLARMRVIGHTTCSSVRCNDFLNPQMQRNTDMTAACISL